MNIDPVALVLGATLGSGAAVALAYVLMVGLFNSSASPTGGALTDASHAVLGVSIGLGAAGFIGSAGARRGSRVSTGVLAGIVGHLAIVAPVFAFTTEDSSRLDSYLVALLFLVAFLVPIGLGTLLGVVLRRCGNG